MWASCVLLLLSLLLAAPPSWGRSFPTTPDSTAAQQQRWGSQSAGYIAEGCWTSAASGASVTVQPCRAYALSGAAGGGATSLDGPSLKGFGDTQARLLTFSGGDGLYWVAGRDSPATTAPGWTCLDGLHYCWILRATPPEAPPGLLVLSRVTVSGGQVTAQAIMAPWRRSTPYVVPAGITLTFGVCPEAGRQQLFVADEVSSGTVRFLGGACGRLLPEWWGIDPTGLVDHTPLWKAVIAAATATVETRTPVSCEGVYKISAAANQWALELKTGLQIIGTYRKGNPSQAENARWPCVFEFSGAGSALYAPDPGGTQSHMDMRFSNLAIYDRGDTGKYGFYCYWCGSTVLEHVYTFRFEVGFFFVANYYYGYASQLKSRFPRLKCAEWTGGINNTSVDIQCSNPDRAGMTHGVSISDPGTGLFGQSLNSRINILSEVGSGIPIYLARIRGGDINAYVETHGVCSDYSPDGVVQLIGLSGGHVTVRLSHNCSGPPIPIGVRGFNKGYAGADIRNVIFAGEIIKTYPTPIQIDAGPGSWGNDLSGISVSGDIPLRTGHFTTGHKLGDNLLTHGGIPLVDEGRGDSGTDDTRWRQGDVILESSGITPTVLRNLLYQVTFGGNPPDLAALMWPALTEVTALDGETTPSLLNGAVHSNRIRLTGTTGDITTFQDGIPGQCLIVRAVDARTIKEGAMIALNGATDFVMTSGDMLHLCMMGGIWMEVGRSVNRNVPGP